MKKLFLTAMLTVLAFLAQAQSTFPTGPTGNGTAPMRETNYVNHWTPVLDWSNNMNVLCTVRLDGVALESEAIEVGAFSGGVCRGSCFVTNFGGTYLALQTVLGNDGDPISFKLYDHAAGQEVDASSSTIVVFETNAMIGIDTPLSLEFTTNVYHNITTAVNPVGSGTATGAGTYIEGATCTLTAAPVTGTVFVNWTLDGAQVASTPSYSFTVTADATYVANFSYDIHAVSATASPAEGGTTSGSGNYAYGQPCTLTATPNAGYDFVGWTLNGTQVSVALSYTFTVTEDVGLVAVFALQQFSIEASGEPAEGGTVTGFGTYNYGDPCTVIATPAANFYFNYWTEDGDIVSTNAGYSFVVTGGRTLVAHFSSSLSDYDITATANPTEAGTVGGAGTYQQGATCILTATPAEGYFFQNWTEDGEVVATNATYSFVVTNDRDLVANFTSTMTLHWTPQVNQYPDNMNVLGTVQLDGVTLASPYYEIGAFCDDQCRGTAFLIPMGEQYLVLLTICGGPGNTFTFKIFDHQVGEEVDALCASTVDFAANALIGLPPGQPFLIDFTSVYRITATANPNIGGIVEGGGTFLQGETCTLTATPAEGYSFVSWTKDGEVVSTDATYSFGVGEAGLYTANFELNSYAITVATEPAEGGTATGEGTYYHGTTCTLTATANEGFFFISWTKDGATVSTDATYSFTVADGGDYVAHFAGKHYIPQINQFSTNMNVIGYVMLDFQTITSGGIEIGAFCGEQCRGSEFLKLMGDQYLILLTIGGNNDDLITFRMYDHLAGQEVDATCLSSVLYEQNAIIGMPDFFPLDFRTNKAITATAIPAEGGTVSGAGSYPLGITCTLTATANENYAFANWTKDGEVVSTDASYSFTVTEPADYEAHFELAYITQSSTLYSGFTWWSSFVVADDVLLQLEDELGDNGILIKSQSDGSNMYLFGNWTTGLQAVQNAKMYMVNAREEQTVNVAGLVPTPSEHPITLNPNWTWIGFPSAEPMDINDAFANFTPQNGDVLKTQGATATYLFGSWNGMTQLTPGLGMMYYSRNNADVTFTYADGPARSAADSPSTAETHWTWNPYAYPYNMSVMAVAQLNGEELSGDRYELAAFADGECRGSARLTYIEPLNRYEAILTLAGDEAASLTFRLYDAATGMVETQNFASLQYETNAIVGSLTDPLVLRFGNTTGIDEEGNSVQLFPNPAQRGECLSLGMTEPTGKVQVEVINALGAVVASQSLTARQAIAAPDMPGVYTLRITVDGKAPCFRKLIVN